jgi:hypothetical protein
MNKKINSEPDKIEIKRKKKLKSASDVSANNPARDFLILFFVIITTPLVFVYSFLRGRIRNPFLIVTFLIVIASGLHYLSKSFEVPEKNSKKSILMNATEEISAEEKEKLKNKISTLREEYDDKKVPPPLYPLLDVPIDMLSINYIIYMIDSGYIKNNGEGSENLLNSYLYSKHQLLKQQSWEALNSIDTALAKKYVSIYQDNIAKKNEELRKLRINSKSKGLVDEIKNSISDTVNNIQK